MKRIADLSDDYEYCILWTGQSTSRPWGTKAEGFSLLSDFENDSVGMDVPASLVFPAATSPVRAVGDVEEVSFTDPNYGTGAAMTGGEWNGCYLRLGSPTAPEEGYLQVVQFRVSGATCTLRLQWLVAIPSWSSVGKTVTASYLIRPNMKWSFYPQVRVLTPYQPIVANDATPGAGSSKQRDIPYPDPSETYANGGRALSLPLPYSVPAACTSFEDLGLLLPFTFGEGINGFGISEIADSKDGTTKPHAITLIAGNVWTFGAPNSLSAANLLNSGYLLVDWETGGVVKRSWTTIVTSTTTTFTVSGSWLGDGNPAAAANVKRYTAWVQHYSDSPHSYLPGEGFTYPNNDMLPYYKSQDGNGALVRNRPRGVTAESYGDQFGDMLVVATRLSMAIGRRVNVVMLGINASGLAPSVTGNNPFAFPGRVGWWNYEDHLTWAPPLSTSIFARLRKLITTVLPNALAAEGNTKTPKFLMHFHSQGESDALGVSSRQHYFQSVRSFLTQTRSIIRGAGFDPYDGTGAKIPFVQPTIAHVTYELKGVYQYYGLSFTFDGDASGLVNNAIREHAASDGFAANVYTDDLPRLLLDPGHFNGVGEAARGARTADAGSKLIEYALSFGSPCLMSTPSAVDICNLAISHLGESTQITSLNDGSYLADLCKTRLPMARDNLLQMRQWSFARRRVRLVQVQMPESAITGQFGYCYVMPSDALNGFAVLPPIEIDEDFDELSVLDAGYSASFVSTYRNPTTIDTTFVTAGVELEPQPYTIEQSPFGHRYILTNQEQATLQYVARVADCDLFPESFRSALSLTIASMLCGPVIKGDAGEALSTKLLQKAAVFLRQASVSDAQQAKTFKGPFDKIPNHMSDR